LRPSFVERYRSSIRTEHFRLILARQPAQVRNKLPKRKITSLLVLLMAICLAVWACQPRGDREAQGPPLKISLALVPFPYSGLIAIAEHQGFFRESGLEVSAKEYPSGLAAVDALCRGEAQLATGADIVMATKIPEVPSLRVVASIGSTDTNEIVARNDRGIREPSDLKGKRIGFSLGTSSEYYLTTFLLANAIPSTAVIPVNIAPARIAEAVVTGEVDAISSWDVNVYNARKRLGNNAVSWPAQNYLEWYWLLIAKAELTQSPEPIKRFLRALHQAEHFILANEEEAKSIISHKWGLEPEFIGQIWDRTRLNVTLNQSMVISMENVARWKLNREGKVAEIPNFLDYIYTDALDEIEPKAITIFR
jgi:ABC-type nitrate/sulfonate/bicarbonate transport system substrate-binding protein